MALFKKKEPEILPVEPMMTAGKTRPIENRPTGIARDFPELASPEAARELPELESPETPKIRPVVIRDVTEEIEAFEQKVIATFQAQEQRIDSIVAYIKSKGL